MSDHSKVLELLFYFIIICFSLFDNEFGDFFFTTGKWHFVAKLCAKYDFAEKMFKKFILQNVAKSVF